MNNKKKLHYHNWNNNYNKKNKEIRLSHIYEMVIIVWMKAYYFITSYRELQKIKTYLQIIDVFQFFEEKFDKEKALGEN